MQGFGTATSIGVSYGAIFLPKVCFHGIVFLAPRTRNGFPPLTNWVRIFFDGIPFGISGTINFILVKHTTLLHPFEMFGFVVHGVESFF